MHYQEADIERFRAPQQIPPRKVTFLVTFVTSVGETNEKFVALAQRLKKEADRIDVAAMCCPTGECWGLHTCIREARVVVFGKREAQEGEDFSTTQLEADVAELAQRFNTPVLYLSPSEKAEDLIDSIMAIINSGA